MNPLKQFYENMTMRETVKDFMISVLKDMAVERTFDGKSVVGIQESRELVEKTFDKLSELYENKPKQVISNSR